MAKKQKSYPIAGTMSASVQSAFGAPDVLKLADIAMPGIGADEVLVQVRAASIGAWVAFLVEGIPVAMRPVFGLRSPRTPVRASDIAGTVVAVGANVTRFEIGDDVYGESDAAFAHYAPASEDALSPKPANLKFAEAAAVPVAGQTALLGLRDKGELQPGQKVLIIGAAGGVGSFAVQIAKAMGAVVTGVCSSGSVDLVASLGADRVIDYQTQDFTAETERYDLILHVGGAQRVADLRTSLTPTGTLVLSSGEGSRWLGPLPRLAGAVLLSPFVKHRLRTYVATPDAANLAYLTTLIEAGELRPVVDQTFPLSETAAALRHFLEPHTQGKTVVTMD